MTLILRICCLGLAFGGAFLYCAPSASPDPRSGLPSPCLALGLADLERWVEPWLSGVTRHQPCRRRGIPAAAFTRDCPGPPPHFRTEPVSVDVARCSATGLRHLQANRLLVGAPSRTAEAIEMLEELTQQTPDDALVWNDLGAAYFVQAARQGTVGELLRAEAALERAHSLAPRFGPVRFNRLLVADALLPPELARFGWNEYAAERERSPWANEAEERRQERKFEADLALASTWPQHRARLLEAAADSDDEAVKSFVTPYLQATEDLILYELLPAWSVEQRSGRVAPASRILAQARRLATAIGELSADDTVLAAVAQLEAGDSGTVSLAALAAAHADLAASRSRQQTTEGRLELARRAGRELLRAGNPVATEARLAEIRLEAQLERCQPRHLAELDRLRQEAETAGRKMFVGQVLSQKGHCLQSERPVEALRAYDLASSAFEGLSDRDLPVRLAVRQASLRNFLGDSERAWEITWSALRHQAWSSRPKDRYLLQTEAARAAAMLGAHKIALALRRAAVREAESGSQDTPEARVHLASALRDFGEARLLAGDWEGVREELERARGIASESPFSGVLLARFRLIEGSAWLKNDPGKARELLSSALHSPTAQAEGTHRAEIHFALSDAFTNLGDLGGAVRELRAGFAELREEQDRTLSARHRGASEDLWSEYFERYRNRVRQLQELLVATGHADETFDLAEHTRALEPLSTLQGLRLGAGAFRPKAEPLKLPRIQKHLAPGVVLLSYSVLDHHLLVWAITQTRAELSVQRVDRATVTAWVDKIQKHARRRERAALHDDLSAPFETLIAHPLAPLGKTVVERIVVVPDQELQGLPFAALLHPVTGRRVIDDLVVSKSPSATLFVYSLLRDAELPKSRAPFAVLIGDPAFDPEIPAARGLDRLREARDEVVHISDLYAQHHQLLDAEATPEKVLGAFAHGEVIHYGGHAVGNARHPERSFLLLAPDPQSTGELYAEELVRDLALPRTRLVFLAACRSAGASPVGSLALAALVRPFFGAGTPGVVGSVWDVQSGAASALSIAFHRRYAAGADAAEALRGAQLELAADPIYESVLAWAPFEVVGFASSPFPRTRLSTKGEHCHVHAEDFLDGNGCPGTEP